MTSPLPRRAAPVAALMGALVAALLTACAAKPDGLRHAVPGLDEPSGLAASRTQTGVFWTHNDSGADPVLYAVTADGRLLARYRVEGAAAVDWEAVTVGDDGFVYIGDIGNNGNDRRDLTVYRVAEPVVPREPPAERVDGTLTVDRAIRFHYPEQREYPPAARNFDAEALFWAPHPDTGHGTLYLLTKHRGDLATVLYRFDALGTPPSGSLALTARGAFIVGGDPARYGGMVTDADATADGRLLAVLTYHALFVFERPAESDAYLTLPRNRIDLDQDVTIQAEAVAWDGDTILFTNEQGGIFRVDEPLAPRSGRFPPGERAAPAPKPEAP
ncbi:MAG: hypothetical protein R3F65_12350 [bacterium]